MSRKTLNEIRKEAVAHYTSHELRARLAENAETEFRELKKTDLRQGGPGLPQRWVEYNEQQVVDIQRRQYANDMESAKRFAMDNAEQLHDLAVIEAHLGGVAINVQQPLEIGQKIEVRTSGHQ